MRMLLLAAVLLPVFDAASAAESLPPPVVHVRDSWKYNTTDGFTNDVLGTLNIRVVEVSDKEITTKIETNTGARSTTNIIYFDKNWNLEDNGSVKFEPSVAYFAFPAAIGAEAKTETRSTNVKTGHSESCLTVSKPAGEEKVTVPAGEFAATRIEVETECRSTEADGTIFQIKNTYWWVASVNRFVKSVTANSSNGRVRNKSGLELVEYAPARQ